MFRQKGANYNMISTIDKFRRNDARLVYLFTNARDEHNIAEWIAHHLLLGFDKIHIFDHKSVTPITHLLKTNFDNRVTVIPVNGEGNIKLDLMTQAVTIAQKNNVSWMIYLDADEFLLLNNFNNVKELLNKFNFADALGINWLMFGTSYHKSQPPGLLTENFIRSEKTIHQHIKSFVRPDKVLLPAVNPHFFNMRNPNRVFAATGNKLAISPFNPVPKLFTRVVAYIAHYYTQSEDEHLRRKGRAMDDGTPHGKSAMCPEVHIPHNDVINNKLQNKYSQRIKAFLAKYGITL